MTENEIYIWSFLESRLGPVGAAAMMGNIKAESGCIPNNLQNIYNKSLSMTDAEYTKAVDNKTYDKFVNDSAGYGLCQWTYWSRKRNLLTYARSKNKSIGDLQMQLEFLMLELESNYKSVYVALKTASDIRLASDVVVKQFERPLNQREEVLKTRASYGQSYYDFFTQKNTSSSSAGNDEIVTYKIKKGDTLSQIAKDFNTTCEAIQKLNPDKIKDINKIRTGWIIRIK